MDQNKNNNRELFAIRMKEKEKQLRKIKNLSEDEICEELGEYSCDCCI